MACSLLSTWCKSGCILWARTQFSSRNFLCSSLIVTKGAARWARCFSVSETMSLSLACLCS